MFRGLRNFNQLSVSIRVSRVDFHLRANFFFKKTARDVFVDDTHWALCAWMMDEWCLTGGIVQTLWDRWELVSKKRRFSQKWGVPIGNQKPFPEDSVVYERLWIQTTRNRVNWFHLWFTCIVLWCCGFDIFSVDNASPCEWCPEVSIHIVHYLLPKALLMAFILSTDADEITSRG